MKLFCLSLFVLLFGVLALGFGQDIKDIKPPVAFAPDFFWVWLAPAAVITVALVLGGYFLLSKLRKKESPLPVTLKLPYQIAFEALQALLAQNLPAQGKIKEFYFELSLIVRRYIEARFSYRAAEMTTEEFLQVLSQTSYLNDSQKNLLKEFLNHCDMVKFARHGPNKTEINQSLAAARQFIEQTSLSQETEATAEP